MDLPIITYSPPTTPADLLRHYHKVVYDLSLSHSESEPLDAGVAISNPKLSTSDAANRMYDAMQPPGATPDATVASVDRHFASLGGMCLGWVLNPSLPVPTELVTALESRGFVRRSRTVFHWTPRSRSDVKDVITTQILPARSAYRQARDLAEVYASASGIPAMVELTMAHLDEPRFDAFLAMREGVAVASIGVMAAGELGLIDDFFVAPVACDDASLARTIMGRAIELCRRSTFSHVFLSAPRDDPKMQALANAFGFEGIGEYVEYVRQ